MRYSSTKQIKSLCRTVAFIVALVNMSCNAFGQAALDESTLKTLEVRRAADIEKFVNEWVSSQIAEQGRTHTALIVARLVVQKPEAFEQAALIRRFGKLLEPEFSLSVLSEIEAVGDPSTRGHLLELLWDTSPANAPAIAKWLTDDRPAENLEDLAKKNPKLKEAIADGAKPFRVCDIAFNVMQQVKGTDESRLLRYGLSEPIEGRNKRIRKVLEGRLEEQTKTNDNKSSTQSAITVPQPAKQIVPNPTESKPGIPKKEAVAWTTWAGVAILIAVVIGLLWLLLRARR